jgi:hypothetical protein
MYQLEPETAGEFEHGMKNHSSNARRWTSTPGRTVQKPLRFPGGQLFSR